MQLPPYSDNMNNYPGWGYPTSRVHRNQDLGRPSYLQPQTPSINEALTEATSRTEMHFRASQTQKVVIAITLFLTIIVVLAVPFFSLQQFIYPNKITTGQLHRASTHTIGNIKSTPILSLIPGPMGKAILPLA